MLKHKLNQKHITPQTEPANRSETQTEPETDNTTNTKERKSKIKNKQISRNIKQNANLKPLEQKIIIIIITCYYCQY